MFWNRQEGMGVNTKVKKITSDSNMESSFTIRQQNRVCECR